MVRRGWFAGIVDILAALGEVGRREEKEKEKEGEGEGGAMLTLGFGQGLGY